MTETPRESYHEYSDESPQTEYSLDDGSLLEVIDELNHFAQTEIIVEEENLLEEIALLDQNLKEFMEHVDEERVELILGRESPEIAALPDEELVTEALLPDADDLSPEEPEVKEVTFASFVRKNSITADITDREGPEKVSSKKENAAFKKLLATYKTDGPQIFADNCDKFVNEHGFAALKNSLNRLLRHEHTVKRGLVNENLGGAIKTLNRYVVENTAKSFTAILDQGTGSYAAFLAEKLNYPSASLVNKVIRQYESLSDVHNENAYAEVKEAIEKAAHRAMTHIETNDKLPTELHQDKIQKNSQAELDALNFIEEGRKLAVKDGGKEARECIMNSLGEKLEDQILDLENSNEPDKDKKISELREELAAIKAEVDKLQGPFLDYYLEKVRFTSLKSGYTAASTEAAKGQQLISSYIIGDLVNSKLIEKRTLTLERYIQVADTMIKNNQLDGAFAIYAALNSTAADTLKTTKEGLSQSTKEKWDKISELLSLSRNSSKLRQHVAGINENSNVPLAYLPPLLIAKDLTGLLETRPLTEMVKMNEQKVTEELTSNRVIKQIVTNSNNTLAVLNQHPDANKVITHEIIRTVEQKTKEIHEKNDAEKLSAPKREVLVDEYDAKIAKRRESHSNHSSKVMARASVFMDEELYEKRTPKAYKEHINKLAETIETDMNQVKKLSPSEKFFQRFEKITHKIEKICTKIVDKVGHFFESIFHKSSNDKLQQPVEAAAADSKKSLLKQADDAKGKPYNCDKDQCPTTQSYKTKLNETSNRQGLKEEEEIVSTPRMRS